MDSSGLEGRESAGVVYACNHSIDTESCPSDLRQEEIGAIGWIHREERRRIIESGVGEHLGVERACFAHLEITGMIGWWFGVVEMDDVSL